MPNPRYRRVKAAVSAAAVAILAMLAILAPVARARAQGKVDATYTATLAGIQLGKGAWVIDIGDDQYSAVSSGVTTGLLRVFASGQGSGMVRGRVSNGALVPMSYVATITADKKTEELHMGLAGGAVKELTITPPPPLHPDRIPVTDAQRHGVTDPMTASLIRVAGSGDPVSSEACHRSTAVFDGRMRYDLTLAFKRMETVKADKGYVGPAAVCAIYFKPIAGYIPNRPALKYLAEQRDMEVWLVPVAGTRVVVPFRLAVPTPLGMAAVQASQFLAGPPTPRLTPTSLHGH